MNLMSSFLIYFISLILFVFFSPIPKKYLIKNKKNAIKEKENKEKRKRKRKDFVLGVLENRLKNKVKNPFWIYNKNNKRNDKSKQKRNS